MRTRERETGQMRSNSMIETGRLRPFLLGIAVLSSLLVCAASASAAEPNGRSYVTQITGLNKPEAVTVAPNDEVWVSDIQNGVISHFSAYPSHTKIGAQTGGGLWGGAQLVHALSVSAANEFLYVGTDGPELRGGGACSGTSFHLFDNYEALYRTEEGDGGCGGMWVAVDNAPQSDSFGRFYRYEAVPGSVRVYDGYGNPTNFTGSAGYISGNRITGTPKGPLSNGAAGNGNPSMSGIAIDPEGDIWIIDQENREIYEFDSTGVFIQRITATTANVPESNRNPAGPRPFGAYPGLSAIAIDPTNGNVLVSDKSGFIVHEFTPQGKYVGQITGEDTPEGSLGSECYFPNGNQFCFTHVTSLSVNSDGYVYVADGVNRVVSVFGPRPVQPTITHKPDSSPTLTGGTVSAVVDPNGGGDIVSCQVEYGTSTEFITREYKKGAIPCTPNPSGGNFNAATEVHADISGLNTEETYHYRFAAGNASETRIGPDHTLTPHAVLGLRADPATGVTSSSGTLHGSFVGNGASTNFWFEYGPTPAYGAKTPLPTPPGKRRLAERPGSHGGGGRHLRAQTGDQVPLPDRRRKRLGQRQ